MYAFTKGAWHFSKQNCFNLLVSIRVFKRNFTTFVQRMYSMFKQNKIKKKQYFALMMNFLQNKILGRLTALFYYIIYKGCARITLFVCFFFASC